MNNKKPRLGISPWVWAELIGEDDDTLIKNAKDLGFQGMEIAVYDEETNLETVKKAIKQYNIKPIISTALTEPYDLIHPDPEHHKSGLRFLRLLVKIANDFGADRIIGPMCAAPGRLWLPQKEEKERHFDMAANNLRKAAQYANDHGVKLALEVMNRFECSFINTAEEGMKLVELVDNPAMGLLLDTFHMNIEEKSMSKAIRLVGSHLHHFHAIENDRGTPGTGRVEWTEVADALKDINYDGWVVIEGFSDKVEWLAKACCIWRKLAPSMTGLASEGREFLTKLFKA